jgi:hypothetical protein
MMAYLTSIVFGCALYASICLIVNIIGCVVYRKDIPMLVWGLMAMIPWTLFYFLMVLSHI